jgi:hypothetical protein
MTKDLRACTLHRVVDAGYTQSKIISFHQWGAYSANMTWRNTGYATGISVVPKRRQLINILLKPFNLSALKDYLVKLNYIVYTLPIPEFLLDVLISFSLT